MITLEFEDIKEAEAAIQKIVDKLDGDMMADALLKVGRKIEARAIEIVPVDTGALRDSIHLENITDRSIEVVADVDNDGRQYALPVEYGRKALNRADAQPFMWPAVQEFATGEKSWEMDVFEAALEEAIEECLR